MVDFAAERAPIGFSDINTVASHEELADIVSGYARVAGFTVQDGRKGSPPSKNWAISRDSLRRRAG